MGPERPGPGRCLFIVCLTACTAAGCMLDTAGKTWWTGDGQVDQPDEDAAAEIDLDLPDPVEYSIPDTDGAADPVVDPDVVTDDGPDVDEPGCAEGQARCEGDMLVLCRDGAWTTDRACPLGCSEGEGRCLQIDPANVDRDLITLAAGDITVTARVGVDTNACDPNVFGAPAPYAQVVPLATDPDLCVMAMASLTVTPTGSIEAYGPRALVLLSAGDVVIQGTVHAGARGTTPGPGGAPGGAVSTSAAGDCGGKVGTANGGADPGSGGGGHGGLGGNGGGTNVGASWPGDGGTTAGGPLLDPISGGCGGGGGRTGDGYGGGAGGAGGGALQISSSTTIRVDAGGKVLAPGGGGLAGALYSSGGGGGAGGGILLEAASVTIAGAVAANGGGGGATDGGTNGFDGTETTDRAAGGTPPSGEGPGGSGGAGGDPNGWTPPNGYWNGGGGGGAAGRVRINSRTGAADLAGGFVSPSSPETFTQGTVVIW